MPIYEYVCNSCKENLEAIQKVNDQPLTICPRCGAASLIKKTSLNSFQLKGVGWYRDGYGARTSNPAADSPPAPSSAPTEVKSPAA